MRSGRDPSADSASSQIATGRISRTVIKTRPGFRAELPDVDLPTLIQMICARRQRQVVRVASPDAEGFLYSAGGRIVHATVGELVGDEAVLCMLAWSSGEFALCARPFPSHATVAGSTESLLLRAEERGTPVQPSARVMAQGEPTACAQFAPHEDDPAPPHDELTYDELLRQLEREVQPPVVPSKPLTESQQLAARTSHRSILPPSPFSAPARKSKLPPPPPASARVPFLGGEPLHEESVVASVRIDASGQLLGSSGTSDLLPQLVAYVSRLIALLRVDFALDPFEALHAELSGLRMLVIEDAGEMVGLLMRPGPAAQQLRQRLGV